MKFNIFIPRRINVGFQKRDGMYGDKTYTGKLAYIIYFDEKDELRKEPSWNSWRDKDIKNKIYNNTPQEGFVLNKKAGGESNGWNHRQTYVRVYDPRGFEFEITIENLLYILTNTNSIKGKGLEGEFIYGWDAGDLILIPLSSPDYEEIQVYNKTRHANKKIGVKDLIIGGTYIDKHNQEYVYMGKFDKWDYDYEGERYSEKRFNINKGKHHFFCFINPYGQLNTIMVKSPSGRFIGILSEDCPANFDDIFDMLEHSIDYSPYDSSKDEFIPYSFVEFYKFISKSHYSHLYSKGKSISIYLDNDTSMYIARYKEYSSKRTQPVATGTLQELFGQLEPARIQRYLANGKSYDRGY